ncbi:Peptidyl-prolyl cis-trans isomerase fpr2 [Hypoxylon texense]
MSSRDSYSTSDSYGYGGSSYSPAVTDDTYRSSKSGNYKVTSSHRSQVSVHNHASSGYEKDAPHPSYGSTGNKDGYHSK